MWFDERQAKRLCHAVRMILKGSRHPAASSRRRGSMLVETAIGIALAIVVMIAVAQLVGLAVKRRRESADIRQATEAVSNVMEHIIVLPWEELTAEETKQFEGATELFSNLAEAEMSITVSRSDDALPTKRIEVALSWLDLARRRVEPVRLVAWKHQATSE
jgi:hypothetical protein